MKLSAIRLGDYERIIELWKTDGNIRLSAADSRKNIRLFLLRNRGMSFKIREDGRIVATLLCGNDGRRGYFHHLFVDPAYRKRGYGTLLVETATARLKKAGITKTHIFVLPGNELGKTFWESIGFYRRSETDVLFYSRDIE